MQIKFLGKTLSQYKGLNGKGGVLQMAKNDIAQVSEQVGKLLLDHYGLDFEVVINESPIHAPKLDKQAKKTAKFKSK